MKKIGLLFLISLLMCGASFAMPKAGTIGIEGSNFIIASPVVTPGDLLGDFPSNKASGIGYLTYNFTNDLSGAIGVILSSDSKLHPIEATNSALGVSVKGLWNLGRGDIVPHLGLQIDNVDFQLPSIDGRYASTIIALLYGFEAMFLPNFSVHLDVRVLDYKTERFKNKYPPSSGEEVERSFLSIFSGTTFGIRWYII